MSAKRIAIVQSSYVPWKGYFDLIRAVDEFVLYDDVQFTRRDWRSRNRIKTANGLLWLSVPVTVKGRFTQRICDTVISEQGWAERHWRSIRHAYARAPHFKTYESALEQLFATATATNLSHVNHQLTAGLCRLLGVQTPFRWSTEYASSGDRTARLVSICRQAGATEYVSGPAARAYLEPQQFEDAGIRLLYADYAGYPEYEQLYPPFEHAVTIIDLLVHAGPESRRFLKDVVPPKL